MVAQDSLDQRLLMAVYSGDSLGCDSLLRLGADPNACTWDSVTALMYAVEGGYPQITALLLDSGADPSRGRSLQDPPLLTAAMRGDLGMLQLLLSSGAAPDIKGMEGTTSLMEAASRNELQVLLALLAAGADAQLTDPGGRNTVFQAAMSGSYECLHALLDHSASPSTSNAYGLTPLMISAINGDLPMLDLLFRYGAATGARDSRGLDATSYAVVNGQTAVVLYLMDSLAPSHDWYSSARLALQTGQRRLYRAISTRDLARVPPPVGYGIDASTGMLWNARDHYASLEATWLEARTNLALSIGWLQRLGWVRVLDRSGDPWLQYRETRAAPMLGAGRPFPGILKEELRYELLPRIAAGYSYARYRGSSRSPEQGLFLLAEFRATLRYRFAGASLGIARSGLTQDGISPWYFSSGISIRLNRVNYNKFRPQY